jgi:hypothetical protein
VPKADDLAQNPLGFNGRFFCFFSDFSSIVKARKTLAIVGCNNSKSSKELQFGSGHLTGWETRPCSHAGCWYSDNNHILS